MTKTMPTQWTLPLRSTTFLLAAMLALWAPFGVTAQALGTLTQTQYLSGHDKDDAVPWDFRCTAGKRANQWTTIPVPSNWEMHGFGVFSYGGYYASTATTRPTVEGRYRRAFPVPASWSGRRTFLVFEGVMTDTEVQVNGQPAGPTHQGGYYRFQYDITKLLKYGQQNLLEVTVTDESSNASINGAERRADYWNFAGIYRPVYLENQPAEFIERAAVNAKADGGFAVNIYGNGIVRADRVEAQIQDTNGRLVGKPFSAPIAALTQTAPVRLSTQITSPRLWTAETPQLYQVALRLKRGATVLHETHQRFGFRTVELRPGDGIYVNGKRVLLKGSARHSFWPDSGRCLSEKISREDIRLMKDMNMNAVRMTHYPPDQHFLDDCDTLGLYVLDEMGGWQHKYDDAVGHRLVQEMVVRDVNHPSILFWDNGNEGGWNTALDDDYALWDPQGRQVIHPWANFRGLDTAHYPNYAKMQRLTAGNTVVMPTEFLHGLYDGGAGAGLADYWDLIQHSKVGGGGFIWAFLDEAVKRVDTDGRLDTHGNQAPDGILGPYREKEGSYLTIKELWSPVVLTDGPTLPPNFSGTLGVENRYSFTDLRQCRFSWELRQFRRPTDAQGGYTVLAHGTATPTTSIPPGASGALRLNSLPANWRQAEALAVQAQDPEGHELWTWVRPLPHSGDFRTLTTTAGRGKVTAEETVDLIRVGNGDLTVALSKQTGQLASVQRAGRPFSLTNGPRLAVGEATLASIEHHADGPDYVINATYTGNLKSVRWRVRPSGWVQIDYTYTLTGPQDFFGVSFDYPEANVKSLKWLGDGPYRTWKNRRAGGTLNVWQNAYNDTVTGDALWQYPEFKGYYGNVRWAQLGTTEGPITAVLAQDKDFLQVLTPDLPPQKQVANTGPAFPAAGISFLQAIPPIGNKFSKADGTGPQGQQTVASGEYHGSVSLFFGALPK